MGLWFDAGPGGRSVLCWGAQEVIRPQPGWWTTARAALGGEPPPAGLSFAGGLAGFIGYEAGRFNEVQPTPTPDPRGDWPEGDGALGRFEGGLTIEPDGRVIAAGSAAFVADAARVVRLAKRTEAPPPPGRAVLIHEGAPSRYRDGVRAVLEQIAEGALYQVNLARRLSFGGVGSALDAYRRARALNPAPFGGWARLGAVELCSLSPELFLRLQGGAVESRPIKGTRPLGTTDAETAALQAELAADPKERAELTMIVDLVRNDLGRVCAPGSVHAGPRQLSALPTLSHAAQSVYGRLKPGVDAFDLLAASFPPGSVTGAPKVAAMATIHALEEQPRGAYCGAWGFITGSGDAELAVSIRVAQVLGDEARVHVGCGVVADSDPDRELAETTLKAQAWRRALTGEGV
ncbi:MAG: Aminodeoxychorismate synthase component 1 [Pseudomonadota bacterium]